MNCENCGIPIEPYVRKDSGTKRFCSSSCWMQFRNATPEAKIQAAEVSRQTAAQRRQKLRSKGRKPHTRVKFKGRHAYRWIAERKLGRPLKPGEIVHHKDENLSNNRPKNLEVMTQSEHARLHMEGR